jgi:hypothetical protein
MRYKLYDKKSSNYKDRSRYVQGGHTDAFVNRLGWWEKDDLIKNQYNDIIIKSLPIVFNLRPDLLAYRLYNRSDYEWVILQYNNIVDINEEFITGVSLIVPNNSRVITDIMTNTSRILDV